MAIDKKLSDPTIQEITSLDGTEKVYAIRNTGTALAPVWQERRLLLRGILASELKAFINGAPVSSELVLMDVVGIPYYLPAGATGSQMVANIAPAASLTFTIYGGASAIGTITFAAGSKIATFNVVSGVYFGPGDVLKVVGPATADLQVADLALTLVLLRFEE